MLVSTVFGMQISCTSDLGAGHGWSAYVLGTCMCASTSQAARYFSKREKGVAVLCNSRLYAAVLAELSREELAGAPRDQMECVTS